MNITFDIAGRKAQIQCENEHIFNLIRQEFSIPNEAKKFARTPAQQRFIQSRIYAITPTGLFDIGMYNEIKQFIVQNQLGLIKETPLFIEQLLPTINDKLYTKLSLQLYDYQRFAAEKCLQNGRGVCLYATGAGKTLIIASILSSLYKNSKCLVVVPDIGLVEQTFKDFSSYNVPFTFCKWSGSNELDAGAEVIIANQDILINRFEKNQWIKNVRCVVVDEVHTLKRGNKITNLISKIKTNNKFGFTGTLPTNNIDKWAALGLIGPIIAEKNSYELRQEGYLTNVECRVATIKYKNKRDMKYRDELDFIYNNEFRNYIIASIAQKLKHNVLILVNHIKHGENLFDKINQTQHKKQVFFIRGSVDVEDRERIKSIMENSNDVICIAMSSIFSVGINVKNINSIIFGAGGKSFVRLVQSIGRGLRKHKNKEELVLFDICDSLKYSSSHFQKRNEIYIQERIKTSTINFLEK